MSRSGNHIQNTKRVSPQKICAVNKGWSPVFSVSSVLRIQGREGEGGEATGVHHPCTNGQTREHLI